MADDKDISEVIAEEAAQLEAAEEDNNATETDEVAEVTEDVTDETTDETEETAEETTDDGTEDGGDKKGDDETSESEGLDAPEHWENSIREAFGKADPATQEVWLNQHKEFQRGFNTVSQEAAQLRRYQQEHIGVQSILDQVIPAWQAQGMNPEQGLGQLVQLGMAYASNPQQTLLHLAEMAGLDLNTLGQDAPYRTSDDIARDNRMNSLEQRLQSQTQERLENEISAFQAETDAEGNLAHPYFTESMDAISNLYRSGFNGTLEQAYEQVIWTNPETRAKLMAETVPAQKKVTQTDQQRNAAAEKAVNASSQRVKQSKPAPKQTDDMDDLSVDELVARVAAQMEAAG